MDQVDAFPSPQSAGWECVEHQGALPKALGLRLGSGGPPEPGVQDGQGWIRARTEEMLGTGSSCTCTLEASPCSSQRPEAAPGRGAELAGRVGAPLGSEREAGSRTRPPGSSPQGSRLSPDLPMRWAGPRAGRAAPGGGEQVRVSQQPRRSDRFLVVRVMFATHPEEWCTSLWVLSVHLPLLNFCSSGRAY